MNRGPKPVQSELSMSLCWKIKKEVTLLYVMHGEPRAPWNQPENEARREKSRNEDWRVTEGQREGKRQTKSSSCHLRALIQLFLIPIMDTVVDPAVIKKKTTCCVAQNFVSGAGVCKWQALICSMGRIGVGSGAVWSSPSLTRKWAVSDMWSKVAKPSPVWVWGFRLQHSVSFEIQRPCLKKKKKEAR